MAPPPAAVIMFGLPNRLSSITGNAAPIRTVTAAARRAAAAAEPAARRAAAVAEPATRRAAAAATATGKGARRAAAAAEPATRRAAAAAEVAAAAAASAATATGKGIDVAVAAPGKGIDVVKLTTSALTEGVDQRMSRLICGGSNEARESRESRMARSAGSGAARDSRCSGASSVAVAEASHERPSRSHDRHKHLCSLTESSSPQLVPLPPGMPPGWNSARTKLAALSAFQGGLRAKTPAQAAPEAGSSVAKVVELVRTPLGLGLSLDSQNKVVSIAPG